VVVSAGHDGEVRVWHLGAGASMGESWRAHQGTVTAVAMEALNGGPMVASGGADGRVRVWQLGDPLPVGDLWSAHSGGVSAVSIGRVSDHPLVVSGGREGSMGIWQPGDAGRRELINLGSPVQVVDRASPCHVMIAMAQGILVLQLPSPTLDATVMCRGRSSWCMSWP
jgi:WD40 repeat protein